MKEECNKESPHEQPAQKRGDDAIGKISVTDRNTFWRGIEIAGDLILGLLAGVCGSTGHPVLAIIVGYFSLCIALALFSQSLIDRWGKSKLIWPICAAVVGFIMFFAVLWINSIIRNEEQQSLSGVLVPANDPMPPVINRPSRLPPIPPNAVFLWLGPTMSWTVGFPNAVIRFGQKDLLLISTNRNGVVVTAEFFGDNGNIVAAVVDNKFTINPLNYFTKEHPDRSTLIVRDQKNIEALNIRFMNPKCLRILGRFRIPGHPDVVMTTNEFSFESIQMHGGDFGRTAPGVTIYVK
jgi:hypothetical protein